MSEVEACDGAKVREGREGIDEAHLTGDRTGAVDDAAVAEDEDLLNSPHDALEEEIPHASILASSANSPPGGDAPRCSGRRTDPQARP